MAAVHAVFQPVHFPPDPVVNVPFNPAAELVGGVAWLIFCTHDSSLAGQCRRFEGRSANGGQGSASGAQNVVSGQKEAGDLGHLATKVPAFHPFL